MPHVEIKVKASARTAHADHVGTITIRLVMWWGENFWYGNVMPDRLIEYRQLSGARKPDDRDIAIPHPFQ
jgi:hypothetical protein